MCRRHGQATLGSMVIKVKGGADDTNRHTRMWGLPGHKINHSIESRQKRSREKPRRPASSSSGVKKVPQPMCLMGSTRVWEGHP